MFDRAARLAALGDIQGVGHTCDDRTLSNSIAASQDSIRCLLAAPVLGPGRDDVWTQIRYTLVAMLAGRIPGSPEEPPKHTFTGLFPSPFG